MVGEVNDNIIQFKVPKEYPLVTACSFCKKPLVKGRFLQAEPIRPAICFGCVAVCNDLLEKENQNGELDSER